MVRINPFKQELIQGSTVVNHQVEKKMRDTGIAADLNIMGAGRNGDLTRPVVIQDGFIYLLSRQDSNWLLDRT